MQPALTPAFANERYRLRSPLGVGGMGAVYAAYDRLTSDTVALKQLRLDPSQKHASESARMRFSLAREFQALAALRHPHIIGVRDYGFDANGQPFFTMDLLEGSKTILQAGHKQPLAAKVALLVQLLYALNYIHRRGIVHRDLKPGNVLTNNGQVKLLDFGLSALSGQDEGPVGTLAYMAPEVLSGRPATPAADFYAFGVLAYELLVGRHPFHTTRQTLVDAVLTTEPEWALVPSDFKPLLARLLHKDPQQRLADGRIAIESLGSALGQTFPVENEATRESFLQAARFVGRKSELDQLNKALTDLATGHGSGWLLGGESGVGKSRLLDEVRTRALVQGAVVLQGQAVSEGGQPFHLWGPSARWLALLSQPTDLEASVLLALVPNLSELLERPIDPAPDLTPQAAQTRLVNVVAELVRRVAADRSVTFFFSDLHWADPNSLDLLAYLAELLGELPLLIVADYRNDEAPALPDQLPHLQARTLTRLAPTEVAELSASMLGQGGRAAHIVQYLQHESEGNTFFMVEVVRALAETAGQLDRVAEMTLPAHVFGGGIQRVVARRLRNVSDSDRQALQWAALIGRQLDLNLLSALGLAEPEAWLTRCVAAAILERQNDEWRFQHDKLREGLVLDLDAAQISNLHATIGNTLQLIYAADLSPYFARLAHHFAQANLPEPEAHYARLAGEQAARQFANAQAIAFLSRALELTPLTDTQARYDLLSQRESIYALIEDQDARRKDLDALAALGESLNDPIVQATLLLREAAWADDMTQSEQAMQLAQRGIALAQSVHAPLLEADLHLLLARTYLPVSRYSDAQTECKAAIAIAQAQNLLAIEALAQRRLGLTYDYANERETARAHYLRALELFQQLGDLRGQAAAYSNLSTNAPYRGDFESSITYGEKSVALARTIGDSQLERLQLGHLGHMAYECGDYVHARSIIQKVLDLSRASQDRSSEGWALAILGQITLATGEYDACERYNQASLLMTRASGYVNDEMIVLHNLANLRIIQDRLDEAAELYERSAVIALDIDSATPPIGELVGLGRIDLLRGHRTTALQRIEPVLPFLTPDYLFGMDDNFEFEWRCYEILRANADPRAPQRLQALQTRLQNYSRTLPAQARALFLNLKINQAILSATQ